MAEGVRAAAQALHPTHLPLSRLCVKHRVTKGDHEAAILSSAPGKEEENFIETRRETVAQTNVAGFMEGSARENEQRKNSTSSSEGAGWPPMPFRSFQT